VAVPRGRVRSLAERWRRDGADLEPLRAVACSTTLLLFGEMDALPWADGVTYLGRHPDAPRLLLPTAARPEVPLALVERALFARFPGARAPAALLLDPLRLVEASSPGRFDLTALEGWAAGGSAA
jgi:hypothetical protein